MRKQSWLRCCVLSLALVSFAFTDHALSHPSCLPELGPPTAAEVLSVTAFPASQSVELSAQIFWNELQGFAQCTYQASKGILTADSLTFPEPSQHDCTGDAIAVEGLNVAYTTLPPFRRKVDRKTEKEAAQFLDDEEVRRGCPNRPQLCVPQVEITSVVPDLPELAVTLNALVTWHDRAGKTSCKFLDERATLNADSLVFESLRSELCVDEITGAGAALEAHYTQDAAFRASVISQLTGVGEALRKDIEIKRNCPNHPTWCKPSSVAVASVTRNYSLEAMMLTVSVVWSGAAPAAVTGTVTCTYPLTGATLTATSLIFDAPSDAVCTGDIEDAAAAAIYHYTINESFRMSVDSQLTSVAAPWLDEVEKARDCPNRPNVCAPPPPPSPPPRRGCMPGGGWPTPPAVCP